MVVSIRPCHTRNLPHFHQNRKLSQLILLTFIRPHIVDPGSNIILFEEFWACAMGTLFFDKRRKVLVGLRAVFVHRVMCLDAEVGTSEDRGWIGDELVDVLDYSLKRGSCGSEGRGALLIYVGLLGDNRLRRVWETLPRFLREAGMVSECEWSEEMRVLMSDRIEFVGQLALGLEAMLG